jgi:CheY-like chemotaxis protein
MAGADLVIHDAQYTPEEYASKRNWGHSHFEYVTELAAAAGVHRLALTHHDPTHDDDFISEIERRARTVAARCRGGAVDVFCAFEGCTIELTSGAGVGPRTAAASATEGAPSAAPIMPAAVSGAALLVVDDNEELRRLTRMSLEREGFRVREAADGVEAGERLKEERPDLMLLDLEMPRVGGLEVLKLVRADADLSAVPVLIMTGSNDGESLREVFDAGAADYITKPYSTPQLMARVRACLARAARAGAKA